MAGVTDTSEMLVKGGREGSLSGKHLLGFRGSADKQVLMLGKKKEQGKIILEMTCLLGGKDRMEENIEKSNTVFSMSCFLISKQRCSYVKTLKPIWNVRNHSRKKRGLSSFVSKQKQISPLHIGTVNSLL